MNEGTAPTVADIGEIGLIERLRARIGEPSSGEVWAGDDTAVLTPQVPALLLTTDLLVEGVDFDLSYCDGRDVGWKALAASASDIAAMCGRPGHAVVALGLPPSTSVRFVDDVLEGLLKAARRWGIAVAGGDISSAAEVSAAVSMTGRPLAPSPVLRSGARPGDSICVTGALGGAAAGLKVLRGERVDDANDAARRLIERQLRPQARVGEAEVLAEFPISAMIDVSDGLAVDLGHLLDSSGVGCTVDAAAIPVDPDISAAGIADSVELAVTGGEDFELLFTMERDPAGAAAEALLAAGTPLTTIGSVTTEGRTLGGRSIDEWRSRGWEHLRLR